MRASGGHVVWEWNHGQGSHSRSDILGDSEFGGRVVRVTTGSQGSEPSLSWPWLAFMARARFGGGGGVVVKNLSTGSTIHVPDSAHANYPQMGGSLLVFLPGTENADLGLYEASSHRLVLLRREKQMTVDGLVMITNAVSAGTMANVGENARQVNGVWRESQLHLIILRFDQRNPLHGLLKCGS